MPLVSKIGILTPENGVCINSINPIGLSETNLGRQ